MAKLLIVDDEQDIRYLYSCELEEAGYEVRIAGSGSEVAARLQEEQFDLVLLDVQIGGENGLEILQNIIGRQKDLPVILCTAFSCYKEDFSSWLADGYVVKSSDLTELKQEVARVLAKKAQTGKTAEGAQ